MGQALIPFMLMLAMSGDTSDVKLRTNFEKTVNCVILVTENKKTTGIRSYYVIH